MAWWMVLGTLFEVVVVVAVLVLIANYVGTPRTDRSLPPSDAPLEIVKRRYANGEITREQFDQLRRDLTDPDLNGVQP